MNAHTDQLIKQYTTAAYNSTYLSTITSMSNQPHGHTSATTSSTAAQPTQHTQFTADEQVRIRQLLERKLGGDEISTRSGAGGQKLSYVTGSKVIELANFIFSFNGWSSSVVNIDEDYCVCEGGKWRCGYTAVVRVSLKDGTYHEDIGYGASINQGDRGAATEKAKKEAVTDGMKRALRLFGNGLGLTIYDKTYVDGVRAGKIQSEALDLTRADAMTTEELNAFEQARKRVKTEPNTDSSYSHSSAQHTNTYSSAASSHINSNVPPQQQQYPHQQPVYNRAVTPPAQPTHPPQPTSANKPIISMSSTGSYNSSSSTAAPSVGYVPKTNIYYPNINNPTPTSSTSATYSSTTAHPPHQPQHNNAAVNRPPVQPPPAHQHQPVQPPSFARNPPLNNTTNTYSTSYNKTPQSLPIPQNQHAHQSSRPGVGSAPPPHVHQYTDVPPPLLSNSPLNDDALANLPM